MRTRAVIAALALLFVAAGCGSEGRPSASPPDWVTTSNWAGYGATEGLFTKVTASWIQPRVLPRSVAQARVSFWVGLDGQGSHAVEQIGTEGRSKGPETSYDAWYEMLPQVGN